MSISKSQEEIEKIKELKYLELNFLSKLKSLAAEQGKIYKAARSRLDQEKIKAIRETINS